MDITGNRVGGNLQCKENTPPPTGGANVVQGNAEDQCAAPAGGQPGSAGPRAGSAPAGGAACSGKLTLSRGGKRLTAAGKARRSARLS